MSSLRKQYEVSEGSPALPGCSSAGHRELSPVLRCRRPCREPTSWNPCWSSSGSWPRSDRPAGQGAGLGSGSRSPPPFPCCPQPGPGAVALLGHLVAFRWLGVLF